MTSCNFLASSPEPSDSEAAFHVCETERIETALKWNKEGAKIKDHQKWQSAGKLEVKSAWLGSPLELHCRSSRALGLRLRDFGWLWDVCDKFSWSLQQFASRASISGDDGIYMSIRPKSRYFIRSSYLTSKMSLESGIQEKYTSWQ